MTDAEAEVMRLRAFIQETIVNACSCPRCSKARMVLGQSEYCTCKIEMATFRQSKSTCPHCNKEIF